MATVLQAFVSFLRYSLLFVILFDIPATVIGSIVLWPRLGETQPGGQTYYLSPGGNDGGPGGVSAPWKTFSYAIPRLNAGDTLILMDGTYDRSNSGYPQITCSSNAKNGTA